jgi:FkbM family methyltransferase
MTTLKHAGLVSLQRILRPADLWICRNSRRPEANRARLFRGSRINWVIDVGAHIGESVSSILAEGWKGRIDSFEPDPRSIDRLRARASKVDGWHVHAMAVGERTGMATLHLAGNEVSSSTLPMSDLHVRSAPDSRAEGTAEVAISRLDDVLVAENGGRIFLKVDVQGGERQVINGARDIIQHVELLQLEISLRMLYDGQVTWRNLVDDVEDIGFTLVGIVPGFSDQESGEMLQFDGIFRRAR